jgi:hypothetical protein
VSKTRSSNYSSEAPDDERQYGSKHVEQSRNNGVINCPTKLHLVGHFYNICIMMHGSMNVKVMSQASLLSAEARAMRVGFV